MAMSSTAATLERAGGHAAAPVRHGATRRAKGGRRHSLLVAGATIGTTAGGDTRRRTTRRRTGARGGGEKGPRGPEAHHECEGKISELGGGRRRQHGRGGAPTAAEKTASGRSIPGSPRRFLLQDERGRRGGAPGLHSWARGGAERRRQAASAGARVWPPWGFSREREDGGEGRVRESGGDGSSTPPWPQDGKQEVAVRRPWHLHAGACLSNEEDNRLCISCRTIGQVHCRN